MRSARPPDPSRVYLVGAADPPAFVHAIFASLFVFFHVFAINMLLSLLEKSALAWQVSRGHSSRRRRGHA